MLPLTRTPTFTHMDTLPHKHPQTHVHMHTHSSHARTAHMLHIQEKSMYVLHRGMEMSLSAYLPDLPPRPARSPLLSSRLAAPRCAQF